MTGRNEPAPEEQGGAEPFEVAARYARRAGAQADWRYNAVNPSVWQSMQERERVTLRLWQRLGWQGDLARRRLLDIGCGTGTHLLDMLRHGFAPPHLAGIDLLPERLEVARTRLPAALSLTCGDASCAAFEAGSFDVVSQSTVFSSLLDDAFQQRLAQAMWRWVKPGGGVLWYDFTMDNPRNPDVRGVTRGRIRSLFPDARVQAWRVTLAPPIARAVAPVHPALYTLFNGLPWLRTHLLAWLAKPL